MRCSFRINIKYTFSINVKKFRFKVGLKPARSVVSVQIFSRNKHRSAKRSAGRPAAGSSVVSYLSLQKLRLKILSNLASGHVYGVYAPSRRAYLNGDAQRRRSIEIPREPAAALKKKSMARKASEHRCKEHLCCRPARKTVKNAVMTHCPRIARDNYTPLRPTRYSLFFRSRPRTEARCGRSRDTRRVCAYTSLDLL